MSTNASLQNCLFKIPGILSVRYQWDSIEGIDIYNDDRGVYRHRIGSHTCYPKVIQNGAQRMQSQISKWFSWKKTNSKHDYDGGMEALCKTYSFKSKTKLNKLCNE